MINVFKIRVGFPCNYYNGVVPADCQDNLVMTAPGGWLELEEPPLFTRMVVTNIYHWDEVK